MLTPGSGGRVELSLSYGAPAAVASFVGCGGFGKCDRLLEKEPPCIGHLLYTGEADRGRDPLLHKSKPAGKEGISVSLFGGSSPSRHGAGTDSRRTGWEITAGGGVVVN